MNELAAAISQARHLLEQRQFLQAENVCRMILARVPTHAEALYISGLSAFQRGEPARARHFLERAVQLSPHVATFHSSLGAIFEASGNRREAIACFRMATTLAPSYHEGWLNLGITLLKGNELPEARNALERAVETSPQSGTAHFFLGLVCDHMNEPERALPAFERAVEIEPSMMDAYTNLVAIHKVAGRFSVARDTCLRAIGTGQASAWFVEELGLLELDLGNYTSSRNAFRRAMTMAPSSAATHSNLLLSFLYDPEFGPSNILAAARDWNARHAAILLPRTRRRREPGKLPLRIGYVSADFRQHPIGFFIGGVLPAHDRTIVHVSCYSDARKPDGFTKQLKDSADQWVDSSEMSDEALARRIVSDGIDILIDLAGHTGHNRLLVFARQPAPVQVSWLGYPATTGMPAIDFFLSDSQETPAGTDVDYIETLVRLPDGYLCYTAPDYAAPVGPLPALTSSGVTFGCFNNLAKLNESAFALWAQILKEIVGSRLCLMTAGLKEDATAARLRGCFQSLGVDPSRLILYDRVPHPEVFEAYNRIDIALDPIPYSGGLTTCEALWMGVPVVTLSGATFASRHSTSHLTNIGLSDFVSTTPEDYVRCALAAVQDVKRLSEIRNGLRARMAASPLCDARRFTRRLEAAFQSMWERTI